MADDVGLTAPGPDRRPLRSRAAVPVVWLIVAVVAFPASLGVFWLTRDSGLARPLCGDRPGLHYPVCQLPVPFGTGSPPTTRGFQP
jgi:hypothetical protein